MLHCVALLMRCHTHNYVELNFPSFYFTKIQIGSTLDRDTRQTKHTVLWKWKKLWNNKINHYSWMLLGQVLTVSSETSLNLNFFSHFGALLNISSFVEFLERNIFLFFISYFWPLIYESFSSFGQRIFFHGSSRAARLLLFSFSRMSTFTSTEGKSTKKGRRLGARGILWFPFSNG